MKAKGTKAVLSESDMPMAVNVERRLLRKMFLYVIFQEVDSVDRNGSRRSIITILPEAGL